MNQNTSHAHPVSSPPHNGDGPVALIVEDDPVFSNVLAFCLRQSGYHPVQHYRGRDVLEACALHPALITLDILLPDVDGWSVLREIKSLPAMQRVPVLIVSALDEAELGFDCGPTAFLHKPTQRDALVRAIEQLAPAPISPMRVLLVDDDPLIGELVRALLPPPRFSVQAVTNTQAAAERLYAGLPDLVLLDLVMPKVSGFEFLQALRADRHTRRLPVLVLTATHLSVPQQNDLSQAARAVITKTAFTPERLMEKLRYLERANPLLNPLTLDEDHRETLPDLDLSQFHEQFMEGARECLATLRTFVADWTEATGVAAIETATRAAHTLKGDAAMLKHAELSATAAQAENLLRNVLARTLHPGPETRTALNEVCEDISQRLESLDA